MRFTEIQYGSPEYRMECELRHAVLRVPLGMNLYDEDLSAESHQRHFGLFLTDETLAACAIAATFSSDEMKIRQMAVRPDFQGLGYGRMLMTMLQDRLAESGIRRLSCHARTHVAGFYESLGFQKSGDEFTEVGIPHVKMERFLERAKEYR
ncbi:MAG: GNAT family N-acetyltransferase [Verrucomicrobiota bacterium]